MKTSHVASIVLFASLVGCAKSDRAPLPGDSVAGDGAVAMSLPRVSTTPAGQTRTTAAELSSIESRLYPPELVMQHQGAIALTTTQRDSIAKETERAHKELLDLQWQLDAEKEKLVGVLDADRVDEVRTKQAAAEVIKREDAIKQGHLAMLVRVKNVLTKEQQEKLRTIREAARCGVTPGGNATATPNGGATVAPSASGAASGPRPRGSSKPKDPFGKPDQGDVY